MKIEIKPLSVNDAWQGRRFKTDKYKAFEKQMLLMLPPLKINFKALLKIDVVFGFSSKGSDVDNSLKPTLDCLSKKYGINDNRIYEINLKKEIVPKGQEFIKLSINEL